MFLWLKQSTSQPPRPLKSITVYGYCAYDMFPNIYKADIYDKSIHVFIGTMPSKCRLLDDNMIAEWAAAAK